MYNFPDNPAVNDLFAPPGGPVWKWDGLVWTIPASAAAGATEWDDIVGKPTTFPPTVPIAWADISGEPATFPPTLPITQSDVTGLTAAQAAQDTAISGKAPTVHTHTTAQVTGLDTALAGKSDTSHTHNYSSLTGIPSSFVPAAHNHPQSEITNLASDLSGKEPTIAAGTTAQYWRGDKAWTALDKTAVGLGSVDNTSDANKPVSTAQAAADALNVLKAGDTMTGDLTISKTTPMLNIVKGASGEEGVINFKTGANLRWKISSNTSAESAGAGSNWQVARYNDAGTNIDIPIQISRSTGISTFTSLTSAGQVTAYNATAIPAGGTAGIGFKFSSTTNLGVFFGSAAPTLSAAKGSLYLNTTATTNTTRMYVNTDGGTTWTGVNTVA